MKRVCRDLGILLIYEFDFGNTTLPSIKIDMKPSTKVRSYQEFAVSRLFWNSFKCHSGILVLPCGAGKTFIGVNVIAALKKTLHNILSVYSCRNTMERPTREMDNHSWSKCSRFSSHHPLEWNPGAEVLITTYAMFSASTNRGEETKRMNTIKSNNGPWRWTNWRFASLSRP